jgi:hypothetical protein
VQNRLVKILGLFFFSIILVLLIDYYIVGTILIGTIMLITGITTVRRDRFSMRFFKVMCVGIACFLIANPFPSYWQDQFIRRWGMNRCNLIQPDHPMMPEIAADFYLWHQSEYGIPFSNVQDFETQVRRVDVYIRHERFVYTLDQYNYHGYYDHLPTIDEILATTDSDGKWHDDCDGISLITASLLIYMGYTHTYISEVTYHYHTMVFREGDDPRTIEGYQNGISLYKGRVLTENDKQSYYLFNQTDLFIPGGRPVYRSVGEILVDGNVWKRDIMEIFTGELTGFPVAVNFGLVLIATQFLGFGAVLYVHAGLNPKFKSPVQKGSGKRKGLFSGFGLFGAFVLNYFISISAVNGGNDLTFLCNPIIILSFLAILYYLNRFFTKLPPPRDNT